MMGLVIGIIAVSLGFTVYKKIGEPIALYAIEGSIRVSRTAYEVLTEENKRLSKEIEILVQKLKK